MSIVGTASRFSVLKIDDEDVVKNKIKVPKANKTKKSEGNKQEETKKKPKPKKKPAANDTAINRGIDQELQSLAFGKAKPKKLVVIPKASISSAIKTDQLLVEPVVEDPEWQRKNEEVASKLFEDDIQQAIFLSKIDYEEKKEFYEQMQQETNEAKAATKKKKKNLKKEKPATMTLGEFNNLLPSEIDGIPGNAEINGRCARIIIRRQDEYSKIITKITSGNADFDQKKLLLTDENFFEKVAQDVKKMVNREQERDHFKKIEPNIPIDVRLLQVHDELEKKEYEIQDLLRERDNLKEENANIKKMNSKLCNILATSQTKEQVNAFLKIDELNKEKDELTQEITILHAALEQEKSKVHALQQLVRTQTNRKEKQ